MSNQVEPSRPKKPVNPPGSPIDRPVTAQPTGDSLTPYLMPTAYAGPGTQGTGCYRKFPTCLE